MRLSKDVLGSMLQNATIERAYLSAISDEGAEITRSDLARLTKAENEYLARIQKENSFAVSIVSRSVSAEGTNAKMFAEICGDSWTNFRRDLAEIGEKLDAHNEANDTTYWVQIACMSHPKTKKVAQ